MRPDRLCSLQPTYNIYITHTHTHKVAATTRWLKREKAVWEAGASSRYMFVFLRVPAKPETLNPYHDLDTHTHTHTHTHQFTQHTHMRAHTLTQSTQHTHACAHTHRNTHTETHTHTHTHRGLGFQHLYQEELLFRPTLITPTASITPVPHLPYTPASLLRPARNPTHPIPRRNQRHVQQVEDQLIGRIVRPLYSYGATPLIPAFGANYD